MITWSQWVFDLIAQNQGAAGATVFLVSMGEALFVVGMIVPSTVVLTGAGALIGAGKLSFWPVFLLSVLGAVAGDAVSNWFGRYFGDRIKTMWPFSNYPVAIENGADFFVRHGGKSVFFGRFVPGVKAVVPGIAGMMGMDLWRFTVVNVISAIAWAAVHILPPMYVSSALPHFGSVNHPLMVGGALVLGALVLIAWIIKYFGQRHY